MGLRINMVLVVLTMEVEVGDRKNYFESWKDGMSNCRNATQVTRFR